MTPLNREKECNGPEVRGVHQSQRLDVPGEGIDRHPVARRRGQVKQVIQGPLRIPTASTHQLSQRPRTDVVLDHDQRKDRGLQRHVQVPGLLHRERRVIGLRRQPLKQDRQCEEVERVRVVGEDGERPRILGSKLRDLARIKELTDHVQPDDCQPGIELAYLLEQRFPLRGPRLITAQQHVVVPQRHDIVGVQLERALVRILGPRRITIPQRRAKRGMGLGQLRVRGQRPVRRRFRAFLGVRRRRLWAVALPQH